MHLSKAKWKEKRKLNAASSNDKEYTLDCYDQDTDSVCVVSDDEVVQWISRVVFMENYYEIQS